MRGRRAGISRVPAFFVTFRSELAKAFPSRNLPDRVRSIARATAYRRREFIVPAQATRRSFGAHAAYNDHDFDRVVSYDSDDHDWLFTSTATIHGGWESTIITSLVPLLHLWIVFVGTSYGQNHLILIT